MGEGCSCFRTKGEPLVVFSGSCFHLNVSNHDLLGIRFKREETNILKQLRRWIQSRTRTTTSWKRQKTKALKAVPLVTFCLVHHRESDSNYYHQWSADKSRLKEVRAPEISLLGVYME